MKEEFFSKFKIIYVILKKKIPILIFEELKTDIFYKKLKF